MSVTVQAAKLSGRVLKAAIAAALQKMEHSRNTPKVGRNSMKRLTARDPGASTIEVTGRIRSFERIAKKHEVRYHIEKDPGTDPPKWTVYFKANQADALTAAFKEYTRKDLARSTRPSLLSQLAKFKELAQALGRDNYSDAALNVNALSEHFDRPAPFVSRYFKEMNGTNLTQYIHKVRLEHVKEKLLQDEKLETIAITCGFGSLRSFLRIFKQYEGVTPTQYRELHSKKEETTNENI
nr:DUF3801 domain-containing protein [Gemmiger formicilis]